MHIELVLFCCKLQLIKEQEKNTTLEIIVATVCNTINKGR